MVRLGFLILLCWMQSLAYAGDDARPNIIVMMADDFGYECVRANGGESYETPNLDRLASEGIRFEQCHVQPLCTPTRVQLMTGLYNVRNYLNFGTLMRTERTFGHYFQDAGYATAICGKWQLGKEQDSPQHFGFQESCLWQHTRRPPRYANPGLEYNGVERNFTNGEYGPDLVNQFAIDFITRHKDEPFFLYYPMILTHDPFQPTPDSQNWDPNTTGEATKRDVKNFADMTAYMDKMIGKIDEHLKQLDIRDNTLLIFLGDNGTHPSITSRYQGRDYRGGKGTTTTRGTHVPLIVNWPALIRSGRVDASLISSVDILPTICEAAGIDPKSKLDGISFLPQLRNQPGQPRTWLYSWYSPRQQANLTVKEFVFDREYKLYRTGEFYRLNEDLNEQRPVAATSLTPEEKEARATLEAALEQFTDARPLELDRVLDATAPKQPKKKAKKP
jgi:arylsulfatase A